MSWVADHHRTHVPFLVEVDGCAVGMAWLVIIEQIPGPENWRRLSGFLQSVYVLPEHRNGGLGSVLLEGLINEARAEDLEYLSVHPSPLSFPFHRRMGFTGEGRLLFLGVIRRIFHVADGQVYRQSHAERPDADSMGTIQAVAGETYFQPKILTLVPGAPYSQDLGVSNANRALRA